MAVGALVLSGCATPAPDPTSTPTPTESAAAERPAAQFPGECADLVALAGVEGIGGAATLDTPSLDGTAANAAAAVQAGELHCTWSYTESAGERDEFGFSVRRHASQIVPTLAGGGIDYPGGRPAELDADASSILCSVSEQTQSCQVAFVVDDYLTIAHVGLTTSADLTQTSAAFTAALADMVDALRDSPVPAPWEPPAGAWSIPIDCADVVANGALAATLGWSGATVITDPALGVEPRGGFGGWMECPFASADSDDGFLGLLASGGAWYWDDVAALPGVVVVEVEGAEHAAVLCDGSPGSCQGVAVVGGNLVSAIMSADMYGDPSQVEAALAALVAGAVALN